MIKIKRSIIACFIGVIIVIGGLFYLSTHYRFDSNNYLAHGEDKVNFKNFKNEKRSKYGMKFDFDLFNGKWSLMKFDSVKGDKITINDTTNIKSGKFYIVVLDSENKIISKHEPNGKSNVEFSIPKTGQYFVRIVGKNASGNFDIKYSSSNYINVTYKDLMSNSYN